MIYQATWHLWGTAFVPFHLVIYTTTSTCSESNTHATSTKAKGKRNLIKRIKPCSDVPITLILVLQFLNLYVYVRQYFLPYSSDIVFSILSKSENHATSYRNQLSGIPNLHVESITVQSRKQKTQKFQNHHPTPNGKCHFKFLFFLNPSLSVLPLIWACLWWNYVLLLLITIYPSGNNATRNTKLENYDLEISTDHHQ